MLQLLRAVFVAAIIAASLLPAHAAEHEWPEKVVRYEDLRALTQLRIMIPYIPVKGAITAPTILRAHIDGSGAVVKVGLLESCGNADYDESAMHAMRDMKFRPYTFGGQPMEVMLVVPLHFPKGNVR